MITVALILIPICLFWFLLSVAYRGAIRPVLRDGVRFKLFELRDELRRAAAEKEVSTVSFQYQFVEKRLCRFIEYCHWVTFGDYLEVLIKNPKMTYSPDVDRFYDKACPQLKAIHRKGVELFFESLIVNSPGWVIAMYPLRLFRRFKALIERKKPIMAEIPIPAFA